MTIFFSRFFETSLYMNMHFEIKYVLENFF